MICAREALFICPDFNEYMHADFLNVFKNVFAAILGLVRLTFGVYFSFCFVESCPQAASIATPLL